MIKRLLEKWFGLEPNACPVCEVLREQLANSERERRELLQRALAPPLPPIEIPDKEEYRPIQPAFIPWRVKQQMLEQEDRVKAKLMADKQKEMAASRVDKLEKELELDNASQIS